MAVASGGDCEKGKKAMDQGVYILGQGGKGVFETADPDGLSAKHPAWAADVKRLAPWAPTTIPDKNLPETRRPAWISESVPVLSATLICSRCLSTMDGLRHMIDSMGLSPWDSLLAAEQMQGRGQKQRSWISPPGNLYVSWYWPDPGRIHGADPRWQAMASLMAGELTAEVLESFGGEVSIKWPNDLLVNNRKVCGILVENRGGYLIAGIGMNLATAPANTQLIDAYATPAASLREAGLKITPLEFWLRLAETGRKRFYELVGTLSRETFVELVQMRLAWKGRKVAVRTGENEAYTAEIMGICPDGGLMISANRTTRVIYTGSILPPDNFR